MIEEDTAEKLASSVSERQNQLIRKFCEEAGFILSQATDYDLAFHMKEALCGRFEEECESSIVVVATTRHLNKLLKERWARK